MRSHMKMFAAVTASLALTLTACGSGGSDSGEATSASGECTPDRVGGSVTQATQLSPRGLDPVGQPGAGSSGGTEVQALFDTLIVYNAQTQEYEPQVAESLDPNEDHTVWTMRLREGVKFGNGDPLTADDVKTSIERHQAPDNTQVSRGEAATITKMDVVDPLTVRFTLDGAYPDFPHVLATDVGMITNQRLVDERGPEKFAVDPTGGGVGPYELEKYVPGDEIVMKAKTDYWGGPVCIQTLRFITLADPEATVDALRTGEVDSALLRDPLAISEAKEAGMVSLPTLYNYGEGLVMNSAEGHPTADPRVRRAIVAAIDPESINQRVFNGTALATSAFISDKTPGLYSGVEGPKFDQDAARKLVAEAKADGWNGRVRLLADNGPTHTNEAIAAKALLEAVGITVDFSNDSSLADVIAKVASDRDYDIVMWGPNYSAEGMWALMNRQLNSASPSNYYGYHDPRMDEALDALRLAATMDERKEIAAKMQEIFDDNPLIANIAAIEEDNVHSPKVGGLLLNRGSVVRFDKAFVESK